MADTLSRQLQLQLHFSRSACRQALQQMALSHGHRQQQAKMSSSARNTGGNSNSTTSQPSLRQTMQLQSTAMSSTYNDLLIDLGNYASIDRGEANISTFESAYHHGPFLLSNPSSHPGPQPRPAHACSSITALLSPFTLAASILRATSSPLTRPLSQNHLG